MLSMIILCARDFKAEVQFADSSVLRSYLTLFHKIKNLDEVNFAIKPNPLLNEGN